MHQICCNNEQHCIFWKIFMSNGKTEELLWNEQFFTYSEV